jgi:hypothetical protein
MMELREVMGLFCGRVPLRTDLSGNPRFCDVVDQLHGSFALAENHELGFHFADEPEALREPRFVENFFNERPGSARNGRTPRTPAWRPVPFLVQEATPMPSPVIINAFVGSARIRLLFCYAKNVIAAQTADRFVEQLGQALERFCPTPSARLGTFHAGF